MTHTDPPDDLLLFTPVATAYRGANGWSSEVQRAFVAALARTGVVTIAARSVGRSARSAYQLRRRAGDDSPFARAWAEAQQRALEEAIDASVATAFEPRQVEVWYRGRHVGFRARWENRLAFAALRAMDRRAEHLPQVPAHAMMLRDDASELPNLGERCEASANPAGPGGCALPGDGPPAI